MASSLPYLPAILSTIYSSVFVNFAKLRSHEVENKIPTVQETLHFYLSLNGHSGDKVHLSIPSVPTA